MPDTPPQPLATAYVRHIPRTIERARRLAPRIPHRRDRRGYIRVPNHADVVRLAVERGLALLETEFEGESEVQS